MMHQNAFRKTDLLPGLAFAVAILLADWLLESFTLDGLTRLAIALLPVPGFFLMVAGMLKLYRHVDEMQQRITLEVAAHVLTLTILAALLLYMLQKAGFLLEWDYFGDVLPYAIILGYGLGYWNTRRRYR